MEEYISHVAVTTNQIISVIVQIGYLIQWVDLGGNLQETIDFPMKYKIFL